MVLTAIDFILVTIVSVKCYTLEDLEKLLDDDPWYAYMTTYQSVGMMMLSIFFLIFGYSAQRKIWRTFTRSEGWKRGEEERIGIVVSLLHFLTNKQTN